MMHPDASILVVDDGEDNLHLLFSVLTAEGYRVRLAANGSLALKSVRVEPPDLILLDIMMPGMSGYEVCETLKADADTREIPIIFISALNDVSNKVRAFEAGGVDYVSRPLQPPEVLARISTHLTLQRLHRHVVAQQRQLATLEERERIERDLHDNITQVMAYIGAQVQAARDCLAQERYALGEQALAELAQVAAKAQDDIRYYILGMRTVPEPERGESFRAMVEQCVGTVEARYDMTVHEHFPPDLPARPVSQMVEAQLLYVVQEALTNVAKHAGVADARLVVRQTQDWVWLTIEDSGCGFETPAQASQRKPRGAKDGDSDQVPRITREESRSVPHFGLGFMRDRVAAVGGTLDLISTPGVGTRITVRVPCMIAAPAESSAGTVAVPTDTVFMRGLRVLLVDDHALLLTALHSMLQLRGIQVVGMAHNGLEAQRLARELYPDIILMDVQMPECDGITATRRIKAELPDVKIVILTMTEDEETFWAALKAGASGYLVKNIEGAEFFERLVAAVRGKMVVSANLASRMLTELAAQDVGSPKSHVSPKPVERHKDLTPRQLEVLQLVAQGLTYRDVGLRLHIIEDTVKYHMRHILDRLSLDDYRAAARYARQHGLLDPDAE